MGESEAKNPDTLQEAKPLPVRDEATMAFLVQLAE